MRRTSHFGLGLVAALCLSASGAAFAATSSGIDTPTGQTSLPIAVEGVAGMTLVNQNAATPANGPVYVGVGTTTPGTTLDVNGPIRAGSATVGSHCSPEGATAYDYNNHEPLFCNQSGIWASSSGGFTSCIDEWAYSPTMYGDATAQANCPAGYTVTGGGMDCESGASVSSIRNYQVGNGWMGLCWAGINHNINVMAVCCH